MLLVDSTVRPIADSRATSCSLLACQVLPEGMLVVPVSIGDGQEECASSMDGVVEGLVVLLLLLLLLVLLVLLLLPASASSAAATPDAAAAAALGAAVLGPHKERGGSSPCAGRE